MNKFTEKDFLTIDRVIRYPEHFPGLTLEASESLKRAVVTISDLIEQRNRALEAVEKLKAELVEKAEDLAMLNTAFECSTKHIEDVDAQLQKVVADWITGISRIKDIVSDALDDSYSKNERLRILKQIDQVAGRSKDDL